MFNKLTQLCLIFSVSVLITGCKSKEKDRSVQRNQVVTQAKAVLNPTKGNKVKGEVLFIQENDGVRVVANITGLTPGKHGFHIHEFGDCSAPDGSSAGDHFNPTHKKHGSPEASEHHIGDLGNLEAGDNGTAQYDVVNMSIKLNGEQTIVGRSIIVHADPDDFTTQPSGNSGKRLACGVIVVLK